jgi:hypothetical protein
VKKLRRVAAVSQDTRFFRKHDGLIEETADAAPHPAGTNAESVTSGHSVRSQASGRVANGTANGFKRMGGASKTGRSGAAVANKKALVTKPLTDRNGSRRRKIFNYHKFYTDMVLQGPAPVIGVEGNAGHAFDQNRPEPMMPERGMVMDANSELISNQKNLIEEQKRLIEEQSRFIQEKTRLIAEKNQLLQRQSELIDNNLL